MWLLHPSQSPWTECKEIAITTKKCSCYLERNPLLWKTHKMRANLCCWCACPHTCVGVSTEGYPGAQQVCSVCSFGPATTLEKSTLAAWERVPFSSGSPVLPVHLLSTPTGWHQFYMYAYPQNCHALQSARGGYT